MAESELRQRKGASASTSADDDAQGQQSPEELRQKMSDTIHSILAERVVSQGRASKDDRAAIDRCVQEDLEKIGKGQTGPLPGIKDETKKAKDALKADPYNLEKIGTLGMEYYKEEKYPEAMNVMARGWKRVAAPKGKSEVEDPTMQFEFLIQFCECSVKCQKYRQAEHIMRDIESCCMPQEAEDLIAFHVLDCKIHCNNDKMTKAHEAFKNALNLCETFEEKTKVWLQTIESLKKVKADTVAKSMMESLAKTDEHKSKLKAIETMNELKESIDAVKPKAAVNWLLLAGALAMFAVLVYMMWWLEQKSLEHHKLKPPSL